MEDNEAQALHDVLTNAFLERAKKPIVWCRLHFGIRIEDLHPPYYEEVIDLIKRHYITDDPMFMSLNFSRDEEAVEEFLSLCNTWIRDTCSIVAVEEGEKKAVGVLIGRVFIKKDMNREFSRVLHEKSPSPVQPQDYPIKRSKRRQSHRRTSKKSIRRKSAKKSIRRHSGKKSIRRSSTKKSIRRPSAKKSIRRSSAKKSIRRSSSKKSIRRHSSKMKRHSNEQRRASHSEGVETTNPKISKIGRYNFDDKNKDRIYEFYRQIDKIPKAPQTKIISMDIDDENAIYKTEPVKKIQAMRTFVSKNFDVYGALSKTKYYKIYLLVVHRDYRRKGIGKALLKSLFGLCRGFRIEVAAGLFTSFISQNMFFKLGGKVGYEINYEDWIIDGDIVFGNTLDPNYSLALMYIDIAEIEKESIEKIEERPIIPRRADLKEKEKEKEKIQ